MSLKNFTVPEGMSCVNPFRALWENSQTAPLLRARPDREALQADTVATSEKVALFGYKAMMKGKSVAIPGFMNSIGVFSVRLTPRSVARKLVKRLHLPLRK